MKTIDNRSPLARQYAKIIIEAIEVYLDDCKNGFVVNGKRLAWYAPFNLTENDKRSASELKASLLGAVDKKSPIWSSHVYSIRVLEKFFVQNNKRNKLLSCSLTTYILKHIYQNATFFLIEDLRRFNKNKANPPQKLPEEERTNFITFIIEHLRYLERQYHSEGEYAYKLASSHTASTKIAFDYYAIAVRNNHPVVIDSLQVLSDKNSDAQYILGVEYFYRKKEFYTAITYLFKAAKKGHEWAKDYLRTADFPIDSPCNTCMRRCYSD